MSLRPPTFQCREVDFPPCPATWVHSTFLPRVSIPPWCVPDRQSQRETGHVSNTYPVSKLSRMACSPGYVWDSRQDTVGIDTPRKEVKAVAAGEIPSPEREAFAPGEGISSSGIGGNHALSLSTHRRRWRAKTAPLPTLFQPSWNQTGAT